MQRHIHWLAGRQQAEMLASAASWHIDKPEAISCLAALGLQAELPVH